MRIKICGLTEIEHVKTCVNNNADFCGFILNYKKSHRYVNFKKLSQLISVDKKGSQYVGVLVNPTSEEIKIFSKTKLDYFQIYGDISVQKIEEIKYQHQKKIIIAIQVKSRKDIEKYKVYQNVADIILFDSSGLEKSLSWNYDWIRNVPSSVNKMLAGNLNIDMLEKLKEITDIVDVSGALETNKVKDVIKIKKFLNKIKEINDQN